MSIFHYTDLNGLKGILDNNSLWATNIRFLNDENESVHGCLCFKNTIEHLNEDIVSEREKIVLRGAIDLYMGEDVYFSKYMKNVYSISFCRSNDKLSQWRGYGNMQGVCLEFDENLLINNLDYEGLKLLHKDVIYTDENSTVEMNDKITGFFRGLEVSELEFFDSFVAFIGACELVEENIPFFKNIGFSEEEEFRFIFTPKNNMKKVSFRVNSYGLIPYLEMKMIEGARLPLKRIIIGPSKDKQLLRSGIEMFLTSKGYDDVEIQDSTVPYRG
ncbi:DUF2971 domain-containing protein [Enterobacter sp. RD4-1-1]|uniref:DUF2971 domain-containing protein n=1 Tax=Enterobacter sp. RD4-1-1 TaxID=2986135 RepID=UPI0021E99843|nr:DUF2971 domain-containing protein [Enterobacter sp. RD4-1-1]MCV3771439.1 DUF2971 domain-containing protein [Enterobacter sp. RD4-1-1]